MDIPSQDSVETFVYPLGNDFLLYDFVCIKQVPIQE